MTGRKNKQPAPAPSALGTRGGPVTAVLWGALTAQMHRGQDDGLGYELRHPPPKARSFPQTISRIIAHLSQTKGKTPRHSARVKNGLL